MSQAIKCTSCGAANQLPEGQDSMFCAFCGSSIIKIKQANDHADPAADPKNKNYLELAQNAMDSSDWDEAITYYNKILEQNPKISDAWFGKGYCLGWSGNLGSIKVDKMIINFKKALEYCSENQLQDMKIKVAEAINGCAMAIYLLSYNHAVKFASVESTYSEHLNRSTDVLFALEYAYTQNPHSKETVESILSISENLITPIRYKNYDDNWESLNLDDSSSIKIKEIYKKYYQIMQDIDPDYVNNTEEVNYFFKAFKNYATFTGRASRKEYWIFFLVNTILLYVVNPLLSLFVHPLFSVIFSFYTIVIIVPSLAVGVRRMHDVGKSGWFLFIPVYNLILLLSEGEKGLNKYGVDENSENINNKIKFKFDSKIFKHPIFIGVISIVLILLIYKSCSNSEKNEFSNKYPSKSNNLQDNDINVFETKPNNKNYNESYENITEGNNYLTESSAKAIYIDFSIAAKNEDYEQLNNILSSKLRIWHSRMDVPKDEVLQSMRNNYYNKWQVLNDELIDFSSTSNPEKFLYTKRFLIKSKTKENQFKNFMISGFVEFDNNQIIALKDTKSEPFAVPVDGKYPQTSLRKISENELFYIIAVSAVKTEDEAKKVVQSLNENGYSSSYLWIPDYKSLSGAELYSVFIGPFSTQYDCEVATEEYRKKHPEAYGLLVSQENKRVQINGIGKVSVTYK